MWKPEYTNTIVQHCRISWITDKMWQLSGVLLCVHRALMCNRHYCAVSLRRHVILRAHNALRSHHDNTLTLTWTPGQTIDTRSLYVTWMRMAVRSSSSSCWEWIIEWTTPNAAQSVSYSPCCWITLQCSRGVCSSVFVIERAVPAHKSLNETCF